MLLLTVPLHVIILAFLRAERPLLHVDATGPLASPLRSRTRPTIIFPPWTHPLFKITYSLFRAANLPVPQLAPRHDPGVSLAVATLSAVDPPFFFVDSSALALHLGPCVIAGFSPRPSWPDFAALASRLGLSLAAHCPSSRLRHTLAFLLPYSRPSRLAFFHVPTAWRLFHGSRVFSQ